jgi:digeranylgeranylglycerophospholipid reductase
MNNVAVIGAGPAGLQTALKIKEEGFDVSVYEEDLKIGQPEHCSGLISRTGIESLNLDINECLQNEIKGAHIFSPNGTKLTIQRPSPVAYVLDRAKFDYSLAKKAKEKGIEINQGNKLIDVRKNSLFLESHGRGELKKAEFIVGADGVNSTVRHLIGLKIEKENFIHSVQATCKGNFNEKMVEIHFGNYSNGFFGWVIPINKNHAKIGLGCKLGENISKNFKQFISEKINPETIGKINSALIPCGPPLQGIQKDNMTIVGDAAFHTKATSGGGVIFGMKAANILGESIANHIKHKTPMSNYEKNLSKINRELKMHWKIRQYFNSIKNEEIDKLLLKLKNKGFEEFLQLEGDMDSPSKFIGKMALSPKYWFLAKTLIGISRS